MVIAAERRVDPIPWRSGLNGPRCSSPAPYCRPASRPERLPPCSPGPGSLSLGHGAGALCWFWGAMWAMMMVRRFRAGWPGRGGLAGCRGGRAEALATAQQASEDSPADLFATWALAELIEAATRSGHPSGRPGPSSGSRQPPVPVALTGHSASRPAREHWSPKGRTPRLSTARRSTVLAAFAFAWNSGAPICSTASGAPSSTTCARSSASSASPAGPSSPGRSSTARGYPRCGTDGALPPALDPEELAILTMRTTRAAVRLNLYHRAGRPETGPLRASPRSLQRE